MTLDEFLRTLDTLIDDREANDDPGEGNFGCEDCRKCNHCRFCVGCDSCTDCTYCEESIDCTSCTQSKRCVSCEKVSYCEDCRDCKNSRYLTLCVECNDCVHCLACVGLEGAEFYVLNEKRTRKEYFALLRQVQELMQARMEVGWRPPGIGIASEIDDPVVAGRDMELTAAPWLDDGRPREPAHEDYRERGRDDPRERIREDFRGRDEFGREDFGVDVARERPGVRSPDRRREPEPPREAPRPRRDLYADEYPEPDLDAPRRAREPRRAEEPEGRRPQRGAAPRYGEEPGYREPEFDDPRRRRGPEREPRSWDEREREPRSWDERETWEREPAPRAPAQRPRDFDTDAVRTHEQQPTQPFGRRPARPRGYEPEPQPEWDDEWDDRPSSREANWEDSRERTVARAPNRGAERPSSYDLREPAPPSSGDEPPLDVDAPRGHDREPSSPWIDEEAQAQARRRAKRGSLRRAGRPKRAPDEGPQEGSGSGRTGSGSGRTGSGSGRGEGTHTTGLRLGRKPKRR